MNHVKWDDDTHYEEILSKISKDNLWEYTQNIVSYQRETGSEDERRAVDYIRTVLEGYHISTRLFEFDAFVGLPEDGEISIADSKAGVIPGRPPAFSVQTPEEGVEAEVVYVGRGTARELDRVDVRGKFALVDGLASPRPAMLMEDRGAVGQIYICGEHIRNMIITSIWGTPTPETAWRIPESHVLSIAGSGGDQLKEAIKGGKTRVRMKVRSFVGWKKAPILIAHIEGGVEPERYAMLCGHIDSWYYGAYDNGATNAAMMEIARIMSLCKNRLRRSLKIAFWTGHSHGRYAGSTWYADNFWEDLHRNCVGNITVDMAGYKGATDYTQFPRLAVTKGCGARVISEIAGQESEGVVFDRFGDQSFWGVGIPTLFCVVSRPTEKQSDIFIERPGSPPRGGCWHTDRDTIDQLDPDILVKDTHVMTLTASYFCMNTVLPLDFVEATQEIVDILGELKDRSGGMFSIDSTIHKAESLRKRAEAFHGAVSGVNPDEREKIDIINQALMRLSRILVPVVQTAAGPFDHDPALSIKRIPTLQSMGDLMAMDEASDAARFLKTRLTREKNRIEHALSVAADVLEESLKEIRK